MDDDIITSLCMSLRYFKFEEWDNDKHDKFMSILINDDLDGFINFAKKENLAYKRIVFLLSITLGSKKISHHFLNFLKEIDLSFQTRYYNQLAKREIINKPNHEYFYACILSGNLDIFSLIYNRIIINEGKNNSLKTMIDLIIRFNRLDMLIFIVEKDNLNLNYYYFNSTPFIQTCFYNHVDMVKYLLTKNINIYSQDFFTGKDALYIACEKNYTEIINILLKF